MKHIITALGALAMTTSLAQAGGVERSTGNLGFMFQDGNYAELTFGSIDPTVGGTQRIPAGPGSPAGAQSGDIANPYTTASLAIKTQLNDRLDFGVLLDQPIGANVTYAGATGYVYGGLTGSTAKISSSATTAVLRYSLNDAVSVYGGLKIENASGQVKLFNGYTMSTSTEKDLGYLVGAAYEKPEIALRVALTYESSITHDFDVTEMGRPSLPFSTEVPQSVTLDFQTGIAKDTLVFGSIRWRDWTAFNITPVGYKRLAGESLVDYEHDAVTYNIGVGRKFNDTWSGAVTLGHEATQGGFAGNLGPTDGYTSLGIAAVYTKGNMKITGGVSYGWIGNAQTEAPLPFPPGIALADFNDNHVMGAGIKIGFSF
jgi:long-subunit fatty acid transport protein